MRKIIIFVLFVILVASYWLSLHYEGRRSLSVILPFTVLKKADAQLRDRIMDNPVYISVDSETELNDLIQMGLNPTEIAVCNVYEEVPPYITNCRAALLSSLKERVLRLPAASFPENTTVLAFELSHFSGSIPAEFLGFDFHWVHRFFPDEVDLLGGKRELSRWRRAFRERGLRFFFFEAGLEEEESEITGSSVFSRRWEELCKAFNFGRYTASEIFISGLWRYVFSVLMLLLLAFFIHWVFIYPLVFLFLPFPFSVQAAAFSFQLLSVFVIYKRLLLRSEERKWPWFLMVMPVLIFGYMLLFGGIYYFMLSWPEFQQRIYLPRGIKIALFAPFMFVVAYELLPFLRREGFKKTLSGFFAIKFLLLFFVALILLALLLIRSGNQTILPIAEFELNLREFLEEVLIARPRTRELFFYAGLFCFVPGVRKGSFFWSMMGKCSLIMLLSSGFNTFSHLHTPWFMAVLRVFNAFWISWLLLLAINFLLLRKKRNGGILHLGYFGFGNFGDELLRLAVKERFPENKNVFIVGPLAEVGIADSEFVYRRDFCGLVEKAGELETFSLGPGGILQDKTSCFSLFYYLFCCWFFYFFCGMRVIWTGQGISPFRYRFSGWLVALTAFWAAKIMVRDPESRDVLLRLGVNEQKISMERDLVFNLSFTNVTSALTKKASALKNSRVAVVLRMWSGFDPRPFLQVMSSVTLKRRYYLFQAEPELEAVIKSVDTEAEIFVFENDIEGWLADFRNNACVIGMRYHGLVLGLKMGLPVLPMIYDQKCFSLVKEYSLSEYLTEKDWENKESLQKTIGGFLQKLKLFSE